MKENDLIVTSHSKLKKTVWRNMNDVLNKIDNKNVKAGVKVLVTLIIHNATVELLND